jgi:hypothetical protein
MTAAEPSWKHGWDDNNLQGLPNRSKRDPVRAPVMATTIEFQKSSSVDWIDNRSNNVMFPNPSVLGTNTTTNSEGSTSSDDTSELFSSFLNSTDSEDFGQLDCDQDWFPLVDQQGAITNDFINPTKSIPSSPQRYY